MEPLAFDPDAWLEAIAADRRVKGFPFMLAWTIARAIRRGEWPRPICALVKDANRERRSIERALHPLEHCGFIRRVRVDARTARIDIIMNGRVAL